MSATAFRPRSGGVASHADGLRSGRRRNTSKDNTNGNYIEDGRYNCYKENGNYIKSY